MKRSHGLLAVSGLAVAVVFAGCSDDPASPGPSGISGSTTGGTPTAGTSTTAGTTSAGTFGTAGTDVGGTGGTGTGGATTGGTGGAATAGSATAGTAGTAGTATAGTGGMAPVIVPTVFLIDNLRLAPKPEGAGGEGGGGGQGGVGGAVGGAGGADGAAAPDFYLPFDADLGPFKIHSDGFSPNVGGDTAGTPFIIDQTTLVWEAATGNPGGTGKVSIPFSVPNQQADFGGTFATPADITGYELTADVKMTGTGTAGSCATVFLYVYGGNGYANDKSAEPAMGVTRHLVKNEWTRVRLDLDGPYGYHSTQNHPNFKPTNMVIWGTQFNTFGCP